METNILDLYTDYLICQNKYATATGMSGMLSGEISHDKVTRFLSSRDFGSKANMEFIQNDLSKSFIIGVKSNRTMALSENDAKNGQFKSMKLLELEEDLCYTVWLKGLSFPVQLIKKIFKNENGSTGVLYLISNDMHINADRLYEVYQKRWRIEEYHKPIKQNTSLAKSPTKKIRTQCNDVFASIIAYCKLESLKIKTKINHFAIKYKLILRANQIALQELKKIMN